MSNVLITPNMHLPNPVPGVDPGPDYANNLSSSLNIVDGHNHTPGNGVQIPPAGLNINSALTMQGNFLTNVGGITMTPQVSTPAAVNTLYVNGVDLYFYDGSADTPIQITKTGSVNA